MGKKAKKRKQRLDELRTSTYRSHDEFDFEKKVKEFQADPDCEQWYMDATVPIWVFFNKKTREFTTIGNHSDVMAMADSFDRAMDEIQNEKEAKASLN